MKIDLNNVNITLNEFQRLSEGKYNAGEVRLVNESTLTKMNNHVHTTGKNVEIITHAEVLAIKEALVKALSQHGVQADEINRVRSELGLAPARTNDTGLILRSVKPLSRQQIRTILDRNAATINKNATTNENGDRVFISPSKTLYAPTREEADRIEKREIVTEQLSEGDRQIKVNKDIANFQSVIAGNVDYKDDETRQAMLNEAHAQLDALYVVCNAHPRENVKATATLKLPSGYVITMPTDKSEAEFARQLEDIIVRLQTEPSAVEYNVRDHYKALSPEEKQAFLAALPNDPQGGFKARIIATAYLYVRGITDYAMLSLPNRLSDADAIALARHLASLHKDVRDNALMQDALLLEMAAKPPQNISKQRTAHVPATSTFDYIDYLKDALTSSFIKNHMPGHALLIANTRLIVRDRLGTKGLPDDTPDYMIVKKGILDHAINEASAKGTVRITEETLRELYLSTALKTAALRIVSDVAKKELESFGGSVFEVQSVQSTIITRHPEFIQELMEAKSPEEADQVVEKYRAVVRNVVQVRQEIKEARAGVEDRVRRGIAEKLGVPLEAMEPDFIQLKEITDKADALVLSIAQGYGNLSTKAEYEKAFNDHADKFIAERIAIFDAVDALDLPQETKDSIKAELLTLDKVKDINIEYLIAEAKKVDTTALEALLRNGAPKEQIYNAMAVISESIRNTVNTMLAGKENMGPDDTIGPASTLIHMVAGMHPGLEHLVAEFFEKPEVMSGLLTTRDYNLLNKTEAFQCLSTNPSLCGNYERLVAIRKKLFIAPRQTSAFKAAGGAERAMAAGYHPSELPMLAKAFALYKGATKCSDADAIAAVLDPQSKARRLLDYGGRFIENAENFAKGLRLMDQFSAWYSQLMEEIKSKDRSNPTKLNLNETIVKPEAKLGVEKFLFEEIAINPSHDLDEQNPENIFGMERNKAMRCLGRSYMLSSTDTFAAIPPEKRGLIYDVFDALDPLAMTQEARKARKMIGVAALLISRILKHYDEVEQLRTEGYLDREHLVPLLYGDLGVAPNADNLQIENQIQRTMYAHPSIMVPLIALANDSGATFDECATALRSGQRLPNAPYVTSLSGKLTELDGTATGGRNLMLGDLCRPTNVKRISDETLVLKSENSRFIFHFPDGETIAAKIGPKDDPKVVAANNAIADKLETLCGKVHQKQLAKIYFCLSQSMIGPNVRGSFTTHDIASDEHMAVTSTLVKDDATGAITITYTEPEGFPVHFHWTATVALDGTVTSTPTVIE